MSGIGITQQQPCTYGAMSSSIAPPLGRSYIPTPARGQTSTRYPFACTFAQVSLSVSVRLKTSASGVESLSGQK